MARAFHRAFALVSLAAWLSLAAQVRVLIGPRGLLPLRELLELIADRGGISLLDFPTLLRWPALAGDGPLLAGALLGAALAALAFGGLAPRALFAASTVLYLSYANAGRTFFAFQWDNLLVECGALAAFLPARRPAPATHLLFRLVLFKLYFESGVAKALSPVHDWTDGSAMSFYYETAPLPTAIAFWAHHLPVGWHRFESWLVLACELAVPFAIFGPRRARLGAAVLFTAFQALNFASANYGFFCPLAAALHLFLLDDEDVERAARWVRRRSPRALAPRTPGDAREAPSRFPRARRFTAPAAVAAFTLLSLLGAVEAFAHAPAWLDAFTPVERVVAPLRLVNTYHLFASVTRERVEPDVQVLSGGGWQSLPLRHKPGDPHRRPGFVAPHQPRFDFQLWFHGLRFQQSHPEYLVNLATRLCEAPDAVAPLFATPLPRDVEAVRVAYRRTTFATIEEHRRAGVWWHAEELGVTPAAPCDK